MTEYENRIYSQGQHANQNWVNSKSINGIKNHIYLQAKPSRVFWLSRVEEIDLVQQFGRKGSKIPHSNLAPDRAKGEQSRIGGEII
jgi:hypothetical protein